MVYDIRSGSSPTHFFEHAHSHSVSAVRFHRLIKKVVYSLSLFIRFRFLLFRWLSLSPIFCFMVGESGSTVLFLISWSLDRILQDKNGVGVESSGQKKMSLEPTLTDARVAQKERILSSNMSSVPSNPNPHSDSSASSSRVPVTNDMSLFSPLREGIIFTYWIYLFIYFGFTFSLYTYKQMFIFSPFQESLDYELERYCCSIIILSIVIMMVIIMKIVVLVGHLSLFMHSFLNFLFIMFLSLSLCICILLNSTRVSWSWGEIFGEFSFLSRFVIIAMVLWSRYISFERLWSSWISVSLCESSQEFCTFIQVRFCSWVHCLFHLILAIFLVFHVPASPSLHFLDDPSFFDVPHHMSDTWCRAADLEFRKVWFGLIVSFVALVVYLELVEMIGWFELGLFRFDLYFFSLFSNPFLLRSNPVM